jgi:hypothetical protein
MYIPEPPLEVQSLCYTASLTLFVLHFSNAVHIHPAIPLLACPTLHVLHLGWVRAYCAYLVRRLKKRQAVIEQMLLELKARAAEAAVLVEVKKVIMMVAVEVFVEGMERKRREGEGAETPNVD